MEPLDSLSVRFHFRGQFEWTGKEWFWTGRRHGMSTVLLCLLSIAELKKHLADHVAISEEAMLNTELCWKMEDGPNSGNLYRLCDQKSVQLMTEHVYEAGIIDIYAKIPADLDHGDMAEEEEEQVDIENASLEFDFDREKFASESEEQHGRIVEQFQPASEENGEQEQQAHVPQQPKAQKLPVIRPTMQEKGKEIKVDNVQETTYNVHAAIDESSDDSDYNGHEADDSNSSGEDEEAISYRELAKELKLKVKKRMLGEEEIKSCKIPDEFLGYESVKLKQDQQEEEEEECFDSEDELSYDEDSDDENALKTRKTKHRVYDESAVVQDFHVGQAFTDSRQFKQALLNYGLKNFHHLKFLKDEKTRVSAMCTGEICPWKIYGSITSKSPWLLVASYNNVHKCVPRRNNKLVTSTVIAEKYFREIKDNPGWRVEKMQEAVLEDLCADVSTSKCKRAKKLVIERIIDQTNGEYSRVFDYHLELVRSNPGSTVAVTLNPDITDRPVFERMYNCFDGCKKGFAAGCRRIVGLDGCFLKGPVSGQLLCAVGRDPNNQMYPIAWACVENENYDSWYWFLSLLQKDLAINNYGDGWVIISDQQKGLIKAVSEIIPEAEHRMCARHIYANWKKQHRDKIYQKMFWACAKSSDKIQFNYNRAKLAQKTEEGAKAMMKTTPIHWCRAFFRLGTYCDSVENNLCESFNNAILRARFYPVISQMEIIRRKVTARIAENRAKSQNWTGTICPNIFKKLKLNIKRSNICSVLYNGINGFEVQEGTWRRFTVNLENLTCSCRYWELSGLPCPHAISAIYTAGRNLDEYIAPCYRIDVYDQIYSHVLQPVEGKENWPIASNPRPFPPMKINMPGRPKTERRREEGEKPKGTKLTKKGIKIRCSLCGGFGHNKRFHSNEEQVQINKAAKRQSKKKEKTAAKGSEAPDSSAQQQATGHVPMKKKHPAAPTAQQQPNPQQQSNSQQPIHVPHKKKQKTRGTSGEHSSSQTSSQPSAQMQFRRSQTIPMSQVVTETVPKYGHGRMEWLLGEKQQQGRASGEGA